MVREGGRDMEWLKNSKIKAVVGLSLIGYLLGFFFSGCGGKKEVFVSQYKGRSIAKDSRGNQYKIVYKSRPSYGSDIFVYKSGDGQNWKEMGRIPSYGYETYEAWGYSLAYDEDKNILGFVCIGTGKGKKAVYFTKSLDNGKTWSNPVPINDDIWAQRTYPKIAIKGENIFVAWVEESESFSSKKERPSGIYFCSSYDFGESWSENVWVRGGEDFWIEADPEGGVYLAYVGGRNQNIIYLSYSEDKGKTWHTQTTDELPMVVRELYITLAGKSLYLIFQGVRPNVSHLIVGINPDYELYYLKSEDKGKTWSKITRLKEE
ncbi:hypothetical protein DRN98_06445 [Methanosarcinales archaeon]|nr:MAG: hypothetical protein DRN98_06445 [Methanosarcinales archaeon]